jgi:hypothetical protein
MDTNFKADLDLESFSKHSNLCLDDQIINRSKYVIASGGSADVWMGSFGSQTVAIKAMRGFSSMGTPIAKDKLLKVWLPIVINTFTDLCLATLARILGMVAPFPSKHT